MPRLVTFLPKTQRPSPKARVRLSWRLPWCTKAVYRFSVMPPASTGLPKGKAPSSSKRFLSPGITRVLAGNPDEYIVVARRKGLRWFVGAITTTERQVAIPLSFLGSGAFDVRSWVDAADADVKPMRVNESTERRSTSDNLTFTMAPGGGMAAVFTPAK